MEPLTPGVEEAPFVLLPGAVVEPGAAVLPVPGPPIELELPEVPEPDEPEVPDVLDVSVPAVPEVEPLMPLPDVPDAVDPEPEPVEVDGLVPAGVEVDDDDELPPEAGSAFLLQAPSVRAAVTAMIAVAHWVMVGFIEKTPWIWSSVQRNDSIGH